MKKVLLMVPLLLAGCGGGLPSCDGGEAKKIVMDILVKKNYAGQGDVCYEHSGGGPWIWIRKDGKCAALYEWRVHDLKTELESYLVRAERQSGDGRSMSCSISTKYRLTSDEKKIDETKGPKQIELTIYKKGDDGTRSYEYQLSD